MEKISQIIDRILTYDETDGKWYFNLLNSILWILTEVLPMFLIPALFWLVVYVCFQQVFANLI